ncbi:hypothetical protein [Paenibacillus hamazuiensis]|uniref:hypothetical protein n=1 Tax=Paenibacillus hamazuiensis TaxID=2936508 RepID=UPI00200EB6BF|nr:hypothetical protein [Paenibacillus hamazuiensis]
MTLSRLTAVALQKAARKTIPVYRTIANNPIYAAKFTAAIRSNNLRALSRLVGRVTSGFNDLGANTFGFNIGFPAPPPANQVENATHTRESVLLTVRSLRSISRRILPLYRKIRDNSTFAAQLVAAARNRDNARIRTLISPLLPAGSLLRVRSNNSSILLEIRSSTGVVFINQFFVL